jgi:hypothetical protein
LPAAVILEPDFGAELPLTSEEGIPGWRQTGFSPQLPGRLADWQEALEAGHHYDTGQRSPQLQGEWARQARELEAAIRAELGSRAELAVLLWPPGDGWQRQPAVLSCRRHSGPLEPALGLPGSATTSTGRYTTPRPSGKLHPQAAGGAAAVTEGHRRARR